MPKPTANNIIACLNDFSINLPSSVELTGVLSNLHNDSRLIESGDIFCAIIGHQLDGRQYIEQAIKQGASLVLCECEAEHDHGTISYSTTGVAVIKFFQLNENLFPLAKMFYQQPQDNMTIVGITGTNGKTTTSQLLAQMLTEYDKPCAIIGTNGAGAIDNLVPIENTTPGACELHQLFNAFNHDKFSHVAMEVSSHALSQKRVLANLFDIALFTNLSRDHLDYHGSMQSYGEAKRQIFTEDNNQVAVVNFDNQQGRDWVNTWPKQQALWLYGRDEEITVFQHYVSAANIKLHSHGVSFSLQTHLGEIDIKSPLLGDFNIDNLLAAISVLLIKKVPLQALPTLVNKVSAIAGRMEASSAADHATAVVDYAHTPDALEKALQACRKHCENNLYVVFGCGGDRDKGKRPLMAKAAEQYADYLVVTNDNPRSEDAQSIANDIVAGFNKLSDEKISIILDREQAVLTTLTKAEAGDIVLLAGKGHEDYVIMPKVDKSGKCIGTEKVSYNERLLVADFYKKLKSLNTLPNEASL